MSRVIDVLGEVIYLEIDGIHADWTTYQIALDIQMPGKKGSPKVKDMPTMIEDTSETSMNTSEPETAKNTTS
ncbi:hypothetical protein L210DRAFT_3650685 [Boletus edulis BED1]|uniref:Uncharacterized protein n=1 Tax=Boletus edulis BED1 TaxID=1328754 RepID=A0AAD4BIN1_BOLED|nr:hypothetical protein L210DRAFT_3650685 [Boletus edulis BED1]